MSRQTWFEVPTQVQFWECEIEDYVGGIAYRNEIICGCCGSVIQIEDLYEQVRDAAADGEVAPMEDEVIIVMTWVPINEEIVGDDFRTPRLAQTTTESPQQH